MMAADWLSVADRLLGGDGPSRSPADLALRHDGAFRLRPHVERLSEVVLDAVMLAERTGQARLIINMPPRLGKSYTTSLWTPVWYLSRFPSRRVIFASHESNYAVSWGRKARDTYKRVAGEVGLPALRPDVSAAGEWENELGGGMLSRGIGSGITGRGAHLGVIDDPIKDFEQAHSSTIRESHWNWWLSTFQTRLEWPNVVIVIQTRWHEDDLSGRLLSHDHEGAPEDWQVLRLPALAEDDDPIGREPGEPLLSPVRSETSEEALARWDVVRADVGSYTWAGLYQQRPSEPKGAIFKRAWFHYWHWDDGKLLLGDGRRLAVEDLLVFQSWDMTFKDSKGSDWVVGQVWGSKGADRVLLDQWRERADVVATIAGVKRMKLKWPSTSTVWVEDAANGPAVVRMLRREIPGLTAKRPVGSKIARAHAVAGQIEAGNVWLPSREPWSSDLMDELAAFPNGAHDDQVDAMTQALIHSSAWKGGGIAMPTGSRDAIGRVSALTQRRIDR